MLRTAATAAVLGLGVAQAAPPAEAFFKPAALHEASLSPSGKRMALSVPAANGRVGVFVVYLCQ